MSKNRENVTWQSADKTWSTGFYDYYSTGDSGDDDYDDEWDVDYTDKFHWVSTGHASAYGAERAWDGANPGGGNGPIEYTPENAGNIAHLDDEAAQTYLASKTKGYTGYNQYPSYQGPAKERNIRFIATDLYKAKTEAARYTLDGYSNRPDERIPEWSKQVEAFEKSSTDSITVEALRGARKSYAEKLQSMIEAKKTSETRSFSTRYPSPDSRKRAFETKARIEKIEAEIAELNKPRAVAKKAPVKIVETAPSIKARTEKIEAKIVEINKPRTGSGKSYHISPTTGRPNQCTASKRACPYGGASDHYPSKEAARKGFEKKMGSGLGKLKK